MKFVMIALVSTLLLGACQTSTENNMPQLTEKQQKELEAIKQLDWLKDADPVAMAKEAIKNKDFKLMSIGGRPLKVPGIDAAQLEALQQKCRLEMVSGTSDVVYGEKHMQLRKHAVSFAEKFNQLLAKHCK